MRREFLKKVLALVGIGLATPVAKAVQHDPHKNAHMGPDRRQWFRWQPCFMFGGIMATWHPGSPGSWVPVELDEVKVGDIILAFDVTSGNVSNVIVFDAATVSDGTGVGTGWTVDVDYYGVDGGNPYRHWKEVEPE